MQHDDNILVVYGRNGISFVDICSIIRIEASSSYSKLFLTAGRTMVVTIVLKSLEEKLSDKGFLRVHRSHLVNTASIQTYNSTEMKVVLRNNEQIAISRRRSTDIRKRLTSRKAA